MNLYGTSRWTSSLYCSSDRREGDNSRLRNRRFLLFAPWTLLIIPWKLFLVFQSAELKSRRKILFYFCRCQGATLFAFVCAHFFTPTIWKRRVRKGWTNAKLEFHFQNWVLRIFRITTNKCNQYVIMICEKRTLKDVFEETLWDNVETYFRILQILGV